MRAFTLCLVAVLATGCASIRSFDGDTVQFESINRETVLVRFTSSPPEARARIRCGEMTKKIWTPHAVRLPVDADCSVTFSKSGYLDETAHFFPSDFAHPSSLTDQPGCGDRGVWCESVSGLGETVFLSILYGTSGLVARAFDGVRNGRGEIGAVLLPLEAEASRDDESYDGSDSAPNGQYDLLKATRTGSGRHIRHSRRSGSSGAAAP